MRHATVMFGLVSVLVLSACDGGDDEAAWFVGTWRPTAGGVKKTCPGDSLYKDALTDDLVWIRGVDSDLVSKGPLTPCRLDANIAAGTAFGVPEHHCTRSDGDDGTVTTTFSAYTFAVAPNGRTALESSSGLITHVRRGEATTCSFSETGSYRRVDEATPIAVAR